VAGKHTMTHHFMHEIISKYGEKEIIGAIDQGFTCHATQTAPSLQLQDLGSCQRMKHRNDDDQK
jgi:hypothetical protein